MDSRLRYLAILGSMGIVVLVLILVLLLGEGDGVKAPSSGTDKTVEAQQAQQQPTDISQGQIGNNLSAFLMDDSFFDKESGSILDMASDLTNVLELMATSVEKDLRVQILNYEGKPVTGETFYLTITGENGKSEEYKDLDRDGIIYAGTLKAGRYEVALLPMEGYQVPSRTTVVQVKDKVEYIPIDDIALLLKTEADIDPKQDDTEIVEAKAEADGTENQKLLAGGAHQKVGIDVSRWQKEIDWEEVAQAGVQFAIIRAGYRGSKTGTLVEDSCFRANIEGAKAAGLEVGVYFFTQAINEVEAVEEASAVLSLLETYDLELPVYIDTEGAGGKGRADNLGVEERTLVCEAFCRTVENAGRTSGVYASKNWLNNNLKKASLDQYETWLAEYRSEATYEGKYSMWQYTSKGSVEGISGNVDLDVYYY